MHQKKYNSLFITTIFVFCMLIFLQNNSFGYIQTKITRVSLNKQTISIYTIGRPIIKKWNFKRHYEKFFILSFKNSILIGKNHSIYTPLPSILKLTVAQFKTNPNIVHIVIRETFLNPFFVKTFHVVNDRYVTIVYPILVHKFKVFLDVGHGGSDPGGVGPLGLPESFVNLSVALKLKRILENRGISVMMDRKSNKFVSLEKRVEEANNSHANIFVGLYCNASKNHDLHGTTTYYYERNSYKFAQYLENYVSDNLGLENDGVVKDDLYVIRNVTKIPAVLIEYAYISNKSEEQLLSSSTFRRLIALTIANAIYNYYILHKISFN